MTQRGFANRIAAQLFAITSFTALATSTAQVAGATPGESSCSYSMSAPVVDAAYPGLVTATLLPTSCMGVAQPAITTVCIRSDGGQSECATNYAWNTAQVFVNRIGAEFTVTGKGCYTYGLNDEHGCAEMPVSKGHL